MATTFGISNTEIYRQPGLTIGINDKSQISGAGEYVISKNQVNTILAKVYPGAYATTIDSEIPLWATNLIVESYDVSIDEGGIATIRIQYIAPSGNQYDFPTPESLPNNQPTYRLEGRISEKSVTEHPKFKALDQTQQIALKELIAGNIIWASSVFTAGEFLLYYPRKEDGSQNVFYVTLVGDSIQFANMIAGGITNYVSPTITWTETSEGSSAMTSAQLNKLGKISSPRGPEPEPSGTRNWMLTGAGQEQRGSADGAIYQTTIEWTLSENGGWNSFLYT